LINDVVGVVVDFLYVDDLGGGGHQIDLVSEILVSKPNPRRGAGVLGLGGGSCREAGREEAALDREA
jgi:hypothetical protein